MSRTRTETPPDTTNAPVLSPDTADSGHCKGHSIEPTVIHSNGHSLHSLHTMDISLDITVASPDTADTINSPFESNAHRPYSRTTARAPAETPPDTNRGRQPKYVDRLTVFDITDLRFADDFAEYVARADSGGSTYGLLKRHAFAQSSLRVRPTCADQEDQLCVSRQRRSKSLIPPPKESAGLGLRGVRVQSPPELGTRAGMIGAREPGLGLPDQKMIIKALCEQTQKQKGAATLQVLQLPVDFRRHSSANCCERRLSLRPPDSVDPAASPSGGADPSDLPADQLPGCVPICRRRSFSVTPKGGLVNEGDEMLPVGTPEDGGGFGGSRRSSYNSTCDGGSGGGGATCSGGSSVDTPVHHRRRRRRGTRPVRHDDTPVYRVLMLGGPGVGKTALTQQFLTSEFMAAQNTSFDDGREICVPVLLDGEESVMEFVDLPYSGDLEVWREYDVNGFIIVYSIIDRRSYQKASDVINSIRAEDSGNSSKPIILVANKSDLERSRLIGKEEGKTLAHSRGCKYTEVSAILNHRVDDLLVGMLKQIRLHVERRHHHNSSGSGGGGRHPSRDQPATCSDAETPSVGGCLTKARNGVLAKLLRVGSGRRGSASKSCENLLRL